MAGRITQLVQKLPLLGELFAGFSADEPKHALHIDYFRHIYGKSLAHLHITPRAAGAPEIVRAMRYTHALVRDALPDTAAPEQALFIDALPALEQAVTDWAHQSGPAAVWLDHTTIADLYDGHSALSDVITGLADEKSAQSLLKDFHQGLCDMYMSCDAAGISTRRITTPQQINGWSGPDVTAF